MTPRSKANPFAQSPQQWKVTFALPSSLREEVFDDLAMAVSCFESPEGFTVELLCDGKPDMEEIKRRLSTFSNGAAPQAKAERFEQKDWLAEVARGFPPLFIGRFYLHGSHVTNAPPPGSIPIRVDAGAAFGSGEHGTTRTCLEALDWLSRRRSFRNILDMGCGSGVLAIAAAKLWNAEVLAADIDAVAVRVAQENARINRMQASVTSVASDGYAGDRIRRAAPFDLVLSNILARPLIAFAPDLARNLAKGGMAVLSGLLASQEKEVLAAHRMQGLALKKRFVQDDWHTLLLERRV
ncbi:MAG: 50S ribosomal protein L11 methyltransferase [Pseudomonadota bacterium]|nr:50S ribosomal protein L11 methyltransferase [Pseudomonadota bacterium]MDE3037748.1 50S ribosomal protein L11 methyltransferase [Pseudomonadota bacterium]